MKMRGDKCDPGRGKRMKIPLLPNNVGKKNILHPQCRFYPPSELHIIISYILTTYRYLYLQNTYNTTYNNGKSCIEVAKYAVSKYLPPPSKMRGVTFHLMAIIPKWLNLKLSSHFQKSVSLYIKQCKENNFLKRDHSMHMTNFEYLNLVNAFCVVFTFHSNYLLLNKTHMVFSQGESVTYMSQKGPGVGKGMLDCVEDIFVGVKSQY